MPRGDGTGPTGQGPRTGRGLGGGGGRMGGSSMGPGGQCICPSCGTKADHQVSVPCYGMECPKCGTRMVREKDGS